MNVRQAAFNPVQVRPHVLSAHPAIFRAHPTRLAAFAPKEALLPRMGRRMKRSVPRANSSIKLIRFARGVLWVNFRVHLVRASVKMYQKGLILGLVARLRSLVRSANIQRISHANCVRAACTKTRRHGQLARGLRRAVLRQHCWVLRSRSNAHQAPLAVPWRRIARCALQANFSPSTMDRHALRVLKGRAHWATVRENVLGRSANL